MSGLVAGAPLAGRVVGLDGVPDPVFAQAMVGPGTAVDPERARTEAVSPIRGTLVKLHPHAFVVQAEAGRAVLVHLGLDTVQLRGEGFELLAAEGDAVEAGQPVVAWDPGAVEAGGRSPLVPVVALDAGADHLVDLVEDGRVEPGAPLFRWVHEA
jgi:PTS system N-acetylglucosamine-specific IIA component